MSRSYIVFGSDDKASWQVLNTVEASTPEQAMGKAREQEAHNHYAAVPERNWTVGTPEVIERAPVVKWKSDTPAAQMTVDDVIAKADAPPARDSGKPVEKVAAAVAPEKSPEPRREGVL